MKRKQPSSNFGLAILAGASLSLACTSTDPDPDPMGSNSESSDSTQMTEDSEASMGDSETSMEAGDGDAESAGDGDGDMLLDCSTIVASGNMVNTVPEDFSLLGSDGTLHSLHSYCNEVVYAVAGTMW